MGIIMDILKDIPLSAVLRERLADQEFKTAALETENADLKAKVVDLELDLQNIQTNQAVHGDVCPYCRHPEGQLLRLVPHEIFGDMGLKIGYYKCAQCGKEYDRQDRP